MATRYASALQRNGQRPQQGGAKLVAQLSRRVRPGSRTESGRSPTFFVDMSHPPHQQLQADIETQLATAEPGVEVLLAEVAGDTVRLFIDHPEGVSLELCERVTPQLAPPRSRPARAGAPPGRA